MAVFFFSLSLPSTPSPWRHRALCHWPPGSGGMSPQAAFPRRAPRKWWWRLSWWSWAGRPSRQRRSSESERMSIARSRLGWTTAGWSAIQSRAMISAQESACSWRICVPKSTLPTVGLSYSGTVKDVLIQTFPFPLSSFWDMSREGEWVEPTKPKLGILYCKSCWDRVSVEVEKSNAVR